MDDEIEPLCGNLFNLDYNLFLAAEGASLGSFTELYPGRSAAYDRTGRRQHVTVLVNIP